MVEPLEVKGILHPQEQARHRTLDRLPPGPLVGRFVEWYWIVRWDLRDQPAYRAEVLPHPSVNVTFEQTDDSSGAFVNGVYTRRFTRELTGRGRVFGVKFWAGGFGAFTGRDVGAVRDRVLPLGEVFDDAERLTDLVLAEPSDQRRRAVVEAYLTERLAADDPSYSLVQEIVSAIVTDRSLTRVDQVTERFGVPIRTLQRLFRRYVGVGPKWVLRRYRLHDGADLLARGADRGAERAGGRAGVLRPGALHPGVQGAGRDDPTGVCGGLCPSGCGRPHPGVRQVEPAPPSGRVSAGLCRRRAVPSVELTSTT